MPSERDRAISLVNDLLDEARVKRSAIDLAKGECDVKAIHRMKREAALFEAAANLIDPSHAAEKWRIDP